MDLLSNMCKKASQSHKDEHQKFETFCWFSSDFSLYGPEFYAANTIKKT